MYLFCLSKSIFFLYSLLLTLSDKLPIVYVYTVVPAVCKYGLPTYIKDSLEQAIYTQTNSEVILVSNNADCKEINKTIAKIAGLSPVDSTMIMSNRTKLFANLSYEIFTPDYTNELWMTSALRFFIMEDLMIARGYQEIMVTPLSNCNPSILILLISIACRGR